jgi:Zn-finger nucleic acid-binding protein
MKCPNCKINELTASTINSTQVYTCDVCKGLWFTKNELENIKDKIPQDAWFDLDIWDDKEKISSKESDKECPVCKLSLYSIDWDDSKIVIDLCKNCNGIWLDNGEFKKVIQYIKDTADLDILNKYGETLKQQVKEVFNDPKHMISEIHDVLTLLNMFQYKFMVESPLLAEHLINLNI